MKFVLYKWAAEALKKIDISDASPIIEETEDKAFLTVPDDKIKRLKLSMTTEISLKGIDNEETVNELGKKLYDIYDEILSQEKAYKL